MQGLEPRTERNPSRSTSQSASRRSVVLSMINTCIITGMKGPATRTKVQEKRGPCQSHEFLRFHYSCLGNSFPHTTLYPCCCHTFSPSRFHARTILPKAQYKQASSVPAYNHAYQHHQNNTALQSSWPFLLAQSPRARLIGQDISPTCPPAAELDPFLCSNCGMYDHVGNVALLPPPTLRKCTAHKWVVSPLIFAALFHTPSKYVHDIGNQWTIQKNIGD